MKKLYRVSMLVGAREDKTVIYCDPVEIVKESVATYTYRDSCRNRSLSKDKVGVVTAAMTDSLGFFRLYTFAWEEDIDRISAAMMARFKSEIEKRRNILEQWDRLSNMEPVIERGRII